MHATYNFSDSESVEVPVVALQYVYIPTTFRDRKVHVYK